MRLLTLSLIMRNFAGELSTLQILQIKRDDLNLLSRIISVDELLFLKKKNPNLKSSINNFLKFEKSFNIMLLMSRQLSLIVSMMIPSYRSSLMISSKK